MDPRSQHFEPTPQAVRGAREFVRQTLSERVGPAMTADLILAVSEMATNAVEHARTPFDVTVQANGNIRVGVVDGSPDVPVRRTVFATAPHGRGLHILDAMCDRWGVEVSAKGKCVWCERDYRSGPPPDQRTRTS